MMASGGCHCGAVRFRVDAAPPTELHDCNCSICAQVGYLHWIVSDKAFTLLSGEADLMEYRFGTGTAQHLFCARCGVKSFYRPRSHPDGISVNARCLDVVLDAAVIAYDGRNWESAHRQNPVR